jgi:succinate dehydrogenase / fumarate reductase flavoprotein subunit/fumarate reductase flavoprotein subunit
MPAYSHHETDVLIIGAGGAGLFAALYADRNTPADTDITVVVKKLAGKSGCTRMVQGGYNAVLHPEDSIDLHYYDTLKGGKYINDQDIAWKLVEEAPKIIKLLENELGVFFDRDEDGHIHQKPFAGQSFDRTVHKGDLTGIEIMTKLRDELLNRDIEFVEETRAVDLLTADGESLGAVCLDMRSGEFEVFASKAVVLATGAGATMYEISTPALEKSADGQAMAYRQGLSFQDMEMMQFHPTGLLAGDTKLTGGVIEEGIRGAGAHLYNGEGERFMEKYAPEDGAGDPRHRLYRKLQRNNGRSWDAERRRLARRDPPWDGPGRRTIPRDVRTDAQRRDATLRDPRGSIPDRALSYGWSENF